MPPGSIPDPPPRAGVPHVLVVDDDPLVLRMLGTTLDQSGFRVSMAGSGEEAVAIFRQSSGDIQLVLLDVQMPGLDGPQTLAVLREYSPRARALFMSGGLGRYSPEQLSALTAEQVLTKPFRSLEDVVAVLRRLAEG